MKKVSFFLLVLLTAVSAAQAQTVIRVFNRILYYDGYAARVDSPAAPVGVIRHRNDLYSRKLTQSELDQIGNHLRINVVIKAACDNYDRIGNVNLALVPKGDTAYHPDSVQRLELARFITPFMNKNFRPDTVPYTFSADNVGQFLRDSALRARYDFWVELQVFGVPYAAQTQVSGCTGRIDVFYGTLDFVTDVPATVENDNLLIPLEFMHNLKNYDSTATDTLGKTTRTISFDVPEALNDAALFLITSNHGAGNNGEEYERRWHYVYFDDSLCLTYKPGRLTCEPFRRYNTQGNGIYGSSVRPPAQWQSFSNWCPGDVITTREVHLGPLAAGNHRVLIRVPAAVFFGNDGYFPVSWYVQGKTFVPGQAPRYVATDVEPAMQKQSFLVYPNPASKSVSIKNPQDAHLEKAILYSPLGAEVFHAAGSIGDETILQLGSLQPGLYALHLHTRYGIEVRKLQIER